MELDSVKFIGIFADGSYGRIHPATVVDPHDVLNIDDETTEATHEQNDDAIEEQMVVVPMKSLLDLDRQTKDLRRQLPEKKGNKRKRVTVDPADMAETLDDSIRGIIKHARSSNLARLDTVDCATQTDSHASVEQVQVGKEKTAHRPRLPKAETEDPKRKTEKIRMELDEKIHSCAPNVTATQAVKRPTPDKNAAPLAKHKRVEHLSVSATVPLDVKSLQNALAQSSLDVRILFTDSMTRSELSLGGKRQMIKSLMELYAKNELNAPNLRIALIKILDDEIKKRSPAGGSRAQPET